MRLVVLFILATSLPAFAEGIDDIDGLRAAVDQHNAALLTYDAAQIAETVWFPHVQFMPDGRAATLASESDLAQGSNTSWEITDASLVSSEKDLAIVRMSFVGAGERAGQDLGAGLWCFTRREGQWRVSWRHYLGVDANK